MKKRIIYKPVISSVLASFSLIRYNHLLDILEEINTSSLYLQALLQTGNVLDEPFDGLRSRILHCEEYEGQQFLTWIYTLQNDYRPTYELKKKRFAELRPSLKIIFKCLSFVTTGHNCSRKSSTTNNFGV